MGEVKAMSDFLDMASDRIKDGLRLATADSHLASKDAGWYADRNTGKPLDRNLPEMIALMHSELSEMLEGVRKGKADEHLPHRSSEEVEAADLLIRLFDYAGYRNLDLAGAYVEKRAYNESRQDHKLENRRKEGGKAF
jgi:NTP pyrophosphatase (non-canonical NTP hydrolase)